MALNGKYELTNVQEFAEYLKKSGIPEEHAKALGQSSVKLEINVEGDKVTLTLDTIAKKTNEYTLGKEIEEEVNQKKIKSTASLTGDVLTIVTNDETKRVYVPTASGLEETITSPGGDVKLNYKRL